MKAVHAAILGGVAALSACQSPVGEGPTAPQVNDPANATLTAEACPVIGDRAYFFWMEPRSAEPGDEIALFPYWTDMPGAYNDLPPGCLGDLAVVPEGAASFRRQEDGLAIATLSPDVAAGTQVWLSGTYRGAHKLSGQVDVYRQKDNPLVGTWRQEGAGCPPESRVRELVFTGGNEMSVTWTPFEVYKDYWGDYRFDPATGAFSFVVEGGNQVPEDMVTEGVVTVEGDRLHLEGVFFGTPHQAGGGCHGDFER